MTPKKFFLYRAVGFAIILIVALGIFVWKAYMPNTNSSVGIQSPVQQHTENTKPPVFVWKFEKASTMNLDGLPETNVFLEAIYSNGETERELIDTTPGGCNELPDSDEDSVESSMDMQCYSAGLGYHFKVTKGEMSYQVKRKTFEEASPEYDPPKYEYEVVALFPFSK